MEERKEKRGEGRGKGWEGRGGEKARTFRIERIWGLFL